MKFTNLFLLAGALLSATSMYAKGVSKNPTDVPGSWWETCKNPKKIGYTLQATCRKIDGTWMPTSIDLTNISNTDNVQNIDGQLKVKN